MKALVGFLLGIILTVIVIWWLAPESTRRGDPSQPTPSLRDNARDLTDDVADDIRGIDTDGIRDSVRDAGERIADASADAVITGKIKTAYATDSAVSALSIDVDTTDGLVTLSGRVSSQHEIDRAVELARAVDGVRQVVSSLQIELPNP